MPAAVHFTIAPVHNLAVANQYLADVLAPGASNIYGTPASITYDGAGTIHAQTECGSFTSLLLQNSYPAVTGSVIKGLTGSTSPDAAHWFDAVSAQTSAPTTDGTFALHARTQVSAIQPGDFLAAKYPNGNSTGHVMTVENITELGSDPNVGGALIPGVGLLNRWRAQVIDSTSTPHGNDPLFPDSRTAAGGQGIGSGFILIYEDAQTGALVGWTWNTQQQTPYQVTSAAAPQYRPMVIGDPEQDKTISPLIYGVNQSLDGAYANGTLRRLGGNRYTAYNWVTNYSNSGNDNGFTNDDYLHQILGGNDQTPGGVLLPALHDDAIKNASTLLTVPINGYVAADMNGAVPLGDPSTSKRFKQEQARKPVRVPFTLTPNPGDPVVYQDEFVNWVKNNVNPNSPVFFSLDNEPDLWSSSHPEVHPNPVTYAELLQKSEVYAAAIKSVMPNAKVFGPASYGWSGYVNLNDAPDTPLNASFPNFLDYYLQQMKAAGNGQRLLDALDLHWYPEARDLNRTARIVHLGPDDGQATTPQEIAAVEDARRQAPRSLWDPSYPEASWIKDSLGGPIDLLPQLLGHIGQNYAGTKLSFSEYNYGGGGDISGGIAEADVLGIFGRQGVYAAAEWQVDNQEPFIGGAFQMYRNFDGNNGTFGDKSVLASTDDVADSSVYASRDSANPSVMTLVVINKTAQPLASVLQLNHVLPGATASIYQLTSASPNPQAAGQMVIADPSQFNYTMPAYSISTIRIVPPSPFVLAGGKLTVNGDQDQPDENDNIVVDTTPAGKTQVTLNQQTMLYDQGTVQSIDIRPGGGTNTISVNRSPVDVDIHGTGTDSVFVGNGSVAGIKGVVHVAEQGGVAELNLWALSGSFTITGSQVLAGNSPLVNYSGVSLLSTSGGPGPFTYVIGDGTHNLDNLPARILLYGSNTPQDTLTMNDGGAADAGVTPVNTTFDVSYHNIIRTESATVASAAGPVSRTFASVISSSGIHNLTLQGSASPTNFMIHGAGGDDVNFSWPQLNIRGGSAADSVTLDDHLFRNFILTPQEQQQLPKGYNLLATLSYLVTDGTVTRNTTLTSTDPATGNVVGTDFSVMALTYSHLASLAISGGQGDDTYTVRSTPAKTAVSINTNAGHDRVTLDDTQEQPGHGLFGNLTIDGQGGTNDGFQGTFKTFTPTVTLSNFASAALDVLGDFTGSFLAPTVGTLAAPIDHITVGGSMQTGSRIKVGYLKNLTVQQNLYGVVNGYGPVVDKATQFTIDTVTVNGALWGATGSLTAPSIRAINMRPASTYAGHATETAPGLDFQSLNLGTVASTGTIDAAIIVSAIVSGNMMGRMSVTGALGSLNVGGSLGGTVSAATIDSVSVGQDLSGQLTATQGMRSLSVGGNVSGSVDVAVGGTPGDDSFVILPTGVLLNGTTAFSGPYTNLRVNGGGGNDSFLVQGVAARAALTIDTSTGGGGNNTITVVMGQLLGPVTLNGTAGTTQVTVKAPAGRNVLTLTATQLTGAGETLNFNLGTTFTRLIVDGSAGTNELIVQGTPPAPLTLINILLPTVTMVTPSATTANFGQALTFTATVGAAVGTPGGFVDFFDTTTGVDLGSAPLSGGTAVWTTSSLTPGSHVLAVSYAGQDDFLASSTSTTVSTVSSTFILNSTANLALALSDNARLQVPGLLQVDSASATALFAGGHSQITAGSIQVAGKALVTDHAGLVMNGQAVGSAALPHASLPDPLAGLPVPQVPMKPGYVPPAIDLDDRGVMTLAPGVYSRITVAGNATLVLRSGIYVVAGGGITLIGNGRITCEPADGHTGVLLYNAGSNYLGGRGTPSYGAFTLGGNATIELTPLTTGPYAGILYFQARDNTRAATLSGDGLALWSGIFYAPKAALHLSGRGQLGGGSLGVSLVVDELHLSANSTAGEMLPNRLALYIDDSHHRLGAAEVALLHQALEALGFELAPFGVTVLEVSTSAAANVVLTPKRDEHSRRGRHDFEISLLERVFDRYDLDESFYLT